MGVGPQVARIGVPAGAFALAAIALALVPVTAGAKLTGYSSPVTLSAGGLDASNPRVASDPDGNSTIVWLRSDGMNVRVQAVRVGVTGSPGPVRTISPSGQGNAMFLDLAVDSDGRSTVTWQEADGFVRRVRAVRLDAAGNPGPVRTVATSQQAIVMRPRVAVDPAGASTVVWIGPDGNTTFAAQARRLDAAGNLGPPRTLDGSGSELQVAAGLDGRSTVVWGSSDGVDQRVRAVRLDPAGSPGSVRTLSAAGQSGRFPAVAIDAGGGSTVAWRRSDGANTRVQSVRLDAAGVPGTTRTLSAPGQNASKQQVGVDAAGRSTVIWELFDGVNRPVQAVRLDAAGVPGAVRTLPTVGQDGSEPEPQVAVDPDGRSTVVWHRVSDGLDERVQAVRLDPTGAPGALSVPSAAGQAGVFPAVAVDPDGRATIAWIRFDGANERVQFARAVIERPQTTIDSGPADGARIDRRRVNFAFSGSPAAEIAGFECALGDEAFSPCTSPQALAELPPGATRFAVRAVDTEGDRDLSPATRSFVVHANLPARLRVDRASVRGNRLRVRGSLARAAAGQRVVLRFRARGSQRRLRARVDERGRFRVARRLRGDQRRARAGRLVVRFRGNRQLRPASERLRASRRPVRLRFAKGQAPRLSGNRVTARGRVNRRAGGRVGVVIEFNRPNGAPAEIVVRRKVDRRGRFRLRRRVPAAVGERGADVSVTHPGRGRLHGQRIGRNVGG